MFPYEISDMCKKCIVRHKKNKGMFKVKCTPVPASLSVDENPSFPLDKVLGKEMYNKLPDSIRVQEQMERNKLLWAKEMLGWSIYNHQKKFHQFYQREMLNCTAKLKVMRLGRRLGKTETVIIDSLHFALLNPNKVILIIGPFQNLIDEIFDRMAKTIDGEKSVFQGMYVRKRQPNEIRFENGSVIKGFTTGLNGDSIRGQSGHRVYFDEAAYIPPMAFRTVMAFLLDNPDVSLIATSTPSALETNFKKWALSSEDWKDFHYPSTVVPFFSEVEKTLRETYTNDDYGLEVLAEFIEGSSKVFKSADITSASEEYEYIDSRKELENPKDWIITLGVDWNSWSNGCQFIVLGFDKKNTHKPFKVLKRISVHHGEPGELENNVQIKSVNTVKELQRDFDLDYVYVDRGHGSMQVEELSRFFHSIGKSHLFKGVDFSSSYKFEDIYSGETSSKRTKVMMIHFLQKRFEMREIVISKTEESDKDMLINQLKDYYIDRYDSKDQPVFAGTDHILDALMLAVFAIVENFSTLFDKSTGNYVGTVNRSTNNDYLNSGIEDAVIVQKKEKVPKSELSFDLERLSPTDYTRSLKRKRRSTYDENQFSFF